MYSRNPKVNQVNILVANHPHMTFLVNPEKDGMYEAVYHESDGGCRLKFYSITKDQAGAYMRLESPALVDHNIKQCSY